MEKKFIIVTKDEDAVYVNILRNDIKVVDILLGLAAIIKIVMQETGKDKLEIFKVVSEFIESSKKNSKKEEE